MFIRFDKSISFEEMVILLKGKMKIRKAEEVGRQEEDGTSTDSDLE